MVEYKHTKEDSNTNGGIIHLSNQRRWPNSIALVFVVKTPERREVNPKKT